VIGRTGGDDFWAGISIGYVFFKEKVCFCLLQLLRKSDFPPPTIKPDIWPPPTYQNRTTFLPKWFETEVIMVLTKKKLFFIHATLEVTKYYLKSSQNHAISQNAKTDHG